MMKQQRNEGLPIGKQPIDDDDDNGTPRAKLPGWEIEVEEEPVRGATRRRRYIPSSPPLPPLMIADFEDERPSEEIETGSETEEETRLETEEGLGNGVKDRDYSLVGESYDAVVPACGDAREEKKHTRFGRPFTRLQNTNKDFAMARGNMAQGRLNTGDPYSSKGRKRSLSLSGIEYQNRNTKKLQVNNTAEDGKPEKYEEPIITIPETPGDTGSNNPASHKSKTTPKTPGNTGSNSPVSHKSPTTKTPGSNSPATLVNNCNYDLKYLGETCRLVSEEVYRIGSVERDESEVKIAKLELRVARLERGLKMCMVERDFYRKLLYSECDVENLA